VASLPIVFVVFSGGPGCGSEPTRKVLDSSSFANAYAQALCTSLKHCCDENLVSYDYTECTRGWKADIERRFLLPNGNYDARIANDCVAKIQAAQEASCQPTQGSVSDARDLCLSIFAGQKPLGAPCVASTECATPPTGRAVCNTSPAGATDGGTLPLTLKIQAQPVCTLVSPPAQGEPCALMPGQIGVTNCGAGLFCDPGTLQCTTRALDGEACKPDGCAAGTYCATLASGSRVCATFAPAGAACSGPDQCDSTTRCDLTGTKTCVFKKAAGEDCANDADCQIGTCDLTSKKCLKNGFATTAACNGRGP
jgi:hypothetical protein